MDKQRKSYYNYYADGKWDSPFEYDLCIDSSKINTDEMIELLVALYEGIKE